MWTGAFTPPVPNAPSALGAPSVLSVRRCLCLVRHAKSDYPPGVPDFDRPLAKRGRRDAPEIGRWLSKHLEPSCAVIVSSATRTKQTWQLIDQEFHHVGEVRFEPAIYEASVEDLIEVLRNQDQACTNVLMVGHSPGLDSLALLLSADHGQDELRAQIRLKFPTSSILTMHTHQPWSAAGVGRYELSDFYVARAGRPRT